MFSLLKVKVLLICLATPCVSLRRDVSRDATSAHRKALQEAINWYYVRYLVYYKTLRKEKKRERRVSREVKGERPVLLARGLCAVMWLAYLNGILPQYTEYR
jgi:hypothetical protein